MGWSGVGEGDELGWGKGTVRWVGGQGSGGVGWGGGRG